MYYLIMYIYSTVKLHKYMSKLLKYADDFKEYFPDPYYNVFYLYKVHKHYLKVIHLCWNLLRNYDKLNSDEVTYLTQYVHKIRDDAYDIHNKCLMMFAGSIKVKHIHLQSLL